MSLRVSKRVELATSLPDSQTAQPRSLINSLATSETVDHCFMGFVFFSLSLRGVQTGTGAALLQSTSVQIPQWNLCGASRMKRADPGRHRLARIYAGQFINWPCLKCLNHILSVVLTPRSPETRLCADRVDG